MEKHFDPNVICECKKAHATSIGDVEIRAGAIDSIPGYLKKYGAKRAFIIADANTYPLAGEKIKEALQKEGIDAKEYVFAPGRVIPDENSVGSVFLAYEKTCDFVIGIGSGVINDIGKIVANVARVPYMIVATAAFMDGYAAGSSSMEVKRVKKTIPAKSPDVIIGDTNILCGAPVHMAKAGFGDMLAKYISICEWRISHLINGEYYCEKVADFTRNCLRGAVENAPGLLSGSHKSMEYLFSGLINAGLAMDYAGCSRPGGGVEHYMCFIWDMRALDFGTVATSHGTHCSLATLYAIKAYQALIKKVPDREKALAYVAKFDFDEWAKELRAFIGQGAEPMIALEAKEKKYDAEKHKARLEIIIDKWDDIVKIIKEELPTNEEFAAILDSVEAPKSLEEVGMDPSALPMTLKCAKDFRDKYVLPRLLWDLGVLDEICEEIF